MDDNLPNLPVEIIDIIMKQNPLDCLNINERYRDIAINLLSLEYKIEKEDLMEYFLTGISSSLFIDFKCFFALNPHWEDVKDKDFFNKFSAGEDSVEKMCDYSNFIFEYITNYLKEFSKSIRRDIYQIDIDFIRLYKHIFNYLTSYYGFDLYNTFRLKFSCQWGIKRDIFGEKLLRDKLVFNTEYLDIVKLAQSLYNMEMEDNYYYGRDSHTYWYISLFIARYNISDNDLSDKLMKMQELLEEKIHLEKTDDGFDIIITENNFVFLTYGNSFCRVGTFTNEKGKEMEFIKESKLVI